MISKTLNVSHPFPVTRDDYCRGDIGASILFQIWRVRLTETQLLRMYLHEIYNWWGRSRYLYIAPERCIYQRLLASLSYEFTVPGSSIDRSLVAFFFNARSLISSSPTINFDLRFVLCVFLIIPRWIDLIVLGIFFPIGLQQAVTYPIAIWFWNERGCCEEGGDARNQFGYWEEKMVADKCTYVISDR